MKKKSSEPVVTDSPKKYPILFYIILASIPVLFFVLLEVGLRFGGYGKKVEVWVPVSEHFPDYICLNDQIASRYFTSITTLPTPWPDAFMKNKASDVYRIFVIGESSAAGFPYDLNAAFSKEIQRRYSILFPDNRIEVINLAFAAINSYTLRDLTPEFIKQKPDVVIIYTGHNEYYGALGVGSTESIGSNRWLINFMLELEEFRTVQLIRDGLSWLYTSAAKPGSDGTLMERMVGEQLIPSGSEIDEAGHSQFEGNLRDIIGELKDAGIPVVLSTLTANLRDQKPFISGGNPPADSVFAQAQKLLPTDSLAALGRFSQARDLDQLKFRAPASFNRLIQSLGKEYAVPVVPIDSLYGSISIKGIPGDELMTDHLHPTFIGYRMMGKWFTDYLLRYGYKPDGDMISVSPSRLDSITTIIYPLTRFDYLSAQYKVEKLKKGWPFVKNTLSASLVVRPTDSTDIEDVFAANFVNRGIGWEEAHVEIANWYRRHNRLGDYLKHMDALHFFAPYNDSPIRLAAETLISKNRLDLALRYLHRLEQMKPDEFTSKWLGIYYLAAGEPATALSFLQTSYQRNKFDAQMLYNFAGALLYNNQETRALDIIRECLKQSPDFPGAAEFERTLVLKLQEQKQLPPAKGLFKKPVKRPKQSP